MRSVSRVRKSPEVRQDLFEATRILPRDVVYLIMKRRSKHECSCPLEASYPGHEERNTAQPVALVMVKQSPSLGVVVGKYSRAMLLQGAQLIIIVTGDCAKSRYNMQSHP